MGVTQSGGAGKPIEANLDEMYLPLRLAEGYEPQNQTKGQSISPEEVLGRAKPLVIRGIAGAGKTRSDTGVSTAGRAGRWNGTPRIRPAKPV